MRRKIIFAMLTALQAVMFMACGGSEEDKGYSVGKLESDEVRVYYYRFDQNYTGYGLYVWGTGPGEIKGWDAGIIEMQTIKGTGLWAGKKCAAYDIKLTDLAGKINIIFRGPDTVSPASDTATQSPNIEGITAAGGSALYFIQQDTTVYTTQPYPMATPVVAEWLDDDTVKVLFNVDQNLNYTADQFTFSDKNDNIITKGIFGQDGKTVTFDAPTVDFSNRYKVAFKSAEYPDAPAVSVYLGYSSTMLSAKDELIYDDVEEGSNKLGATLEADGSVTLRLWSPTAVSVKAYFYDKADQTVELHNAALTLGSDSVWSVNVPAASVKTGETTLDTYFYQYEIQANGKTVRALDPYAKSMAAFNPPLDSSDQVNGAGKAAIVDMSAAASGVADKDVQANYGYSRGGGNKNNMVVYEVHVRDFTIDDSFYASYSAGAKGKFLGFAEKMGENYSAGSSYLKDLGITHVQLLPVFNHYRLNEAANLDLQDESVTSPNYNWGYDPHNYFTPEGAYATDASNPYTRIAELRKLVKACHAQGVGVIADVVYNHTYHNWILDRVAPGCYYRKAGGSTPVGEPAVASENPMTRKLIIDSLKHMKEQYGVDGVRYDLLGFTDTQTIVDARTALGSEFVMHGEAWNFTDLKTDQAPIKGFPETYPHNIDLAMFNDSSRDSYAGNMSGTGFIHGVLSVVGKVRAAIIGNLVVGKPDDAADDAYSYDTKVGISTDNYDRTAHQPNEILQYLSCHDGYTLWDKINLSTKGDLAARMKMVKKASALLFLSQGKIFIQGGDEIARTKPLPNKLPANSTDPTKDRAHTTTSWDEDPDLPGYSYLHENSYQSSDFVNKFRWNRLRDSGNPMQASVASLYQYYKDLIAMRKAIPAFRMADTATIRTNLKLFGSEMQESSGGFASMAEIGALTVKFINGPANTKIYCAGEAQAKEDNPTTNDISCTLDDSGSGQIAFTSAQVDAFRLTAWGASDSLNIKMVETPGAWTVTKLEGAYSGMGNNKLDPKYMTKVGTSDAEITIDLSITDHSPGAAASDPYVAWQLVNYTDSAAGTMLWNYFIVAINPTAAPVEIPMNYTFVGGSEAGWTCILDGETINYTAGFAIPAGVTMAADKITVPAGAFIVLAK